MSKDDVDIGNVIYQRLCEAPHEGLRLLLEHYEGFWRAYLHKRYAPALNNADFDEIINAAAWKILRAIHQFDPNRCQRFRTWCFVIMNHLAIDYLRAARQGQRFVQVDWNLWVNMPTALNKVSQAASNAEALPQEVKMAVLRAFKQLPPKQQEILKIYAENEGICSREVAALAAVDSAYARLLYKRAKDKMRDILTRFGYEPQTGTISAQCTE